MMVPATIDLALIQEQSRRVQVHLDGMPADESATHALDTETIITLGREVVRIVAARLAFCKDEPEALAARAAMTALYRSVQDLDGRKGSPPDTSVDTLGACAFEHLWSALRWVERIDQLGLARRAPTW